MESNAKKIEEANSSFLLVKSGVDIMKDAIFQEIVTCVESNGIILALLEGSKEETVLQQIVDTLHKVRVLGLTHDACRILVSHDQMATNEEKHASSMKRDTETTNLMAPSTADRSQQNISSHITLEEGVRNALFGEIVQSIAKNECSLIMATGLKSDDTLQTALEVLGNACIIYLAPDACEVLLVNRLKPSKKKSTIRSRSAGKSLSQEKTCHICQKQFSKRSGLLTHQKAFHDKFLPHKCDLCNKAFVYPKELRMHKLSHTGERPYHCDICNKGFIARKDVQRHQPVHTGERAFVCQICKATFAHKANLDRHVKSKHEGRRPYVCSLCVDKKYCDRGGLRKHLASVHRIFDVPRKKVVHRMIPSEEIVRDSLKISHLQSLGENYDMGQTTDLIHTEAFTTNHNVALTGETVILGELDVSPATVVEEVTNNLSTSSDHVNPDSAVHILSDTHIVESASKILQQLSQNIAELSENQSAHQTLQLRLNDSGGQNIPGKPNMAPTMVKTSGELLTTQTITEQSDEALINIAFTDPKFSVETSSKDSEINLLTGNWKSSTNSLSEEDRNTSETNVNTEQLNKLEDIQTALQIVESPSS